MTSTARLKKITEASTKIKNPMMITRAVMIGKRPRGMTSSTSRAASGTFRPNGAVSQANGSLDHRSDQQHSACCNARPGELARMVRGHRQRHQQDGARRIPSVSRRGHRLRNDAVRH